MSDTHDERIEVGVLKMRVEGEWWVARYHVDSPDPIIAEIGRIKMASVKNPARRATFVALMQACVGDIIQDATGSTPIFDRKAGT